MTNTPSQNYAARMAANLLEIDHDIEAAVRAGNTAEVENLKSQRLDMLVEAQRTLRAAQTVEADADADADEPQFYPGEGWDFPTERNEDAPPF